MFFKSTPSLASSQPRQRLGLGFALVFAALGLPAHASGIRFCIDQANPMFNTDVAIAAAAAAQEDTTANLVVRDRSQDDEDSDSGLGQNDFFHKLSQSCDLIMGFPVEANVLNLPDGMGASLPYAATGFVTATTTTAFAGFNAMGASYQLGVVMLTVTSTYFTDQTMSHEHVYYSNDQLYDALLDGEVNAALIWQPWLDHQLAAHPEKLHVAPLEMPHAAWNIVALFPVSQRNSAAVRSFNAGITALALSGRLHALDHPYNVPKINQ